MNGRKALSLALAGIAVMSLAFGTGAFTSVSAERGVSVSVVDDDRAYVGYNSNDVMVTDHEDTDLVTVTNRFASDIEIEDVSVGSSDSIEESALAVDDGPITPGESASITWDEPDCSVLTQSTVTMTVEVAGAGVWAKIYGDTTTREFDVTCAPSEAVRFNGVGTVRVDAADRETVTVEYWTTNASANSTAAEVDGPNGPETIDVGVNENLDPGDRVIAIYVQEYDVTYVHPGYDVSTGDTGDWGAGNGQPYAGIPEGLAQ